MYFVHQVHRLRRRDASGFEASVRDDLMGAIATEPGARLIWYAWTIDAAVSHLEAITMVAVEDPAALTRLSERTRSGDLASIGARLDDLRVDVQTRIAKPLRYNPLNPSLADVPTTAADHATVGYMHDFVPPCIGQARGYEDAMSNIYMAMTDTELLDVVLWAGLEPVAGPVPEQMNISRIQRTDAVVKLITDEFPRDIKKLGSWMFDALKVRDHWTTRLARCASWSPLY